MLQLQSSFIQRTGFSMLQRVDRKRCASCDRWSGERQIGNEPETIEVTDEMITGLCQGGPWDNSERRAKSACGHWIRWHSLQ